MVTKDSFISILWRLIPYWLNNWEQQWGSECNSMMFELHHFALELLVILPCIQVRSNFSTMPLPCCHQLGLLCVAAFKHWSNRIS